jgi:hypothetical protein
MKISSTKSTKYILEEPADWDNPVFKDARFSEYYRSAGIPGVVVLGFQKPNQTDWFEVETRWAWMNDDRKMKLKEVPIK